MSQQPLLKVDNLTRRFDVSKPWLNRMIEREPKQILTAVNQVSFEVEKVKALLWWVSPARVSRPLLKWWSIC